MIKGKDH